MIKKKNIRNLDNYLLGIPINGYFYVGTVISDISIQRLLETGFEEPLEAGMKVLPKILGSVSRFNAKGSFIIHRDRPKETCYRQATIIGWHGYEYDVIIPYQRYPRTEIPAPSIEIQLMEKDNELIAISPRLLRSDSTEKSNLHIINLFLELFGECEILNVDFEMTIANIPIRKLNWEILPQGEYIWEQTKPLISGIIERRQVMKAKMFEYRAEFISQYNPSQLMIGKAGFKGYLIFYFQQRNLYVLENLSYGNATYILKENWEQIAQMTKAEIVNEKLHEARIIHQKGWERDIDKYLK